MAWTTPRTWVDGEIATAALFNTHIRDNLNAIAAVGIDGWTDYSGSATMLGSGSNPTYTVNKAVYCQVGKLVRYRAKFTIITAGTGGYTFGLPVTAASIAVSVPVGAGTAYDLSLTDTWLMCMDNNDGTTVTRGLWDQQTSTGVLSQTSPFTAAVNDVYTFGIKYRAA